MALTNPKTIFGIHSFTPYDRATKLPYGTFLVLGGSEFALTGEVVPLNGGSNRFPWDIQDGLITAELTVTAREYPDAAFQVLLGKDPTNLAAEAGGAVTTITNAFGTSVVAANGIASVSVVTPADVKFVGFIVKAVSATTVDVYAYSNLDFARGVDGVFQDDLLKITSAPLTITTGGNTTIPNFGVQLTGGAGAIAMTTGDTAYFNSRPINLGSRSVTVGGTADQFPEFGAYVTAQQQGSQAMQVLDIFRIKAIGMPINMTAKEFSEWSFTGQAFYDPCRDGVFEYMDVDITNPCA